MSQMTAEQKLSRAAVAFVIAGAAAVALAVWIFVRLADYVL
jgi:hypothetical protein